MLPIVFFISGVLIWTFLEYVIHRFLGHAKSKRVNTPFTKEHRRHHAEFHYFAPAWKKALTAVVVLVIFTVVIGWPMGWNYGFAFAMGLSGMYLFYEIMHWVSHQYAPKNAYGRWVRKNHFYHHFRDPSKNHGVTSPLWDYVFGTHASVDFVRVPRKGNPLQWLIDNATGEILSQFRNDYRLAEG